MLADERDSTHMYRSARSFGASIALAVCLWLVAASAQAQDLPAAGPVLSVDQVRSAFTGYLVDPALNWEWTSPPVTTFQVHDLANGRVLMVLVYPDVAAAQAERGRATMREQDETSDNTIGSIGPFLITGYGHSVWNANVALVQTTQSELDRMFRLQNDRDNGVLVDPDSLLQGPRLPEYAVDLDFQQALQTSVFNL
jgi:hypothetical protein